MAQSDQQMLTTKKSLIGWYRDQLAKFYRLGIGKFTENNTNNYFLVLPLQYRVLLIGVINTITGTIRD